MRWRDLDDSCPELRVHEVVADHRQAPAHQGELDGASVQVPVAVIVRMHRDRGVAEHGFGTGRGDHDAFVASTFNRITQVPQRPLLSLVLDLKIRNRGESAGVPVDHVLAAVDQAALVQADKALGNRPRQSGVHREPLSGPVAARAYALELPHDLAAVGLLPTPHVLEEFLPPERPALDAVLGQAALNQHLGGDAGVVGARQPEHVAPAHALPAHRNVDLRGLEHMPHVQGARDVGRRDHQREDGFRRGGVGFEETFANPPLRPRWFDLRGIVGFF